MSTGFDAGTASFFDGDSPVAQDARLLIDADVLWITPDTGAPVRWPLQDVRQLRDIAGRQGVSLRLTTDPLARLFLTHKGVLRHFPHLNKRAAPQGRGRLLGWALAAVAAVALQIFVLIPLLADNLAGFIPAQGERALGEATFGHIREALDETGLSPVEICENADGVAALTVLTERLNVQDDPAKGLSVAVLDHPMVNAFALPGGYVVLFRGLIEAANGPDEVAAVLAHEIGHVVSRDPTRNALRSAGSIGVLGLLFGDFAGGAAVLFLTERLISAQYSQAAEVGADAFAHVTLENAGISPGALGDMFESMRKAHGDADGLTAHFLSHPSLGSRIDAARAVVSSQGTYTASLDAAAWADLQTICDR